MMVLFRPIENRPLAFQDIPQDRHSNLTKVEVFIVPFRCHRRSSTGGLPHRQTRAHDPRGAVGNSTGRKTPPDHEGVCNAFRDQRAVGNVIGPAILDRGPVVAGSRQMHIYFMCAFGNSVIVFSTFSDVDVGQLVLALYAAGLADTDPGSEG